MTEETTEETTEEAPKVSRPIAASAPEEPKPEPEPEESKLPEPPKKPPCEHDWRIIDTQVDRMYGADRNPMFSVECRKCSARTTARGQKALKALSKRRPLPSSGLG